MKKYTLALLILTSTVFSSMAQTFLPPLEMFSTKKEGYLITMKGEKIVFIMKDLDRKKGLIVNVEGKTKDGKKFELKASEIKEMAIPPSDFAKLSGAMDATKSIKKAQKTNLNEYDRELVYFYQEYLEDRKITALMQLINPDFCSKIRVYHDPYAKESAGIAFGGVQINGGIDKSYYLKVDGKTQRYFKSDYDKTVKTLFGTCDGLFKKYTDTKWRDFPDHLYYFDQECDQK